MPSPSSFSFLLRVYTKNTRNLLALLFLILDRFHVALARVPYLVPYVIYHEIYGSARLMVPMDPFHDGKIMFMFVSKFVLLDRLVGTLSARVIARL